ncbi:MAG: YgiQ family radical SAM protein, partial [Methylophilaceae bacterium]
YGDVPLVVGGIEASLRRIAHYDYWSDKVRRSVLIDAKADILLYGNAERALIELSHRIARGEKVHEITDIRGTAFIRKAIPEDWLEVDSTQIDRPGPVAAHPDPYEMKMGNDASCATADPAANNNPAENSKVVQFQRRSKVPRDHQVIRLPSYEEVVENPVLYAHASRILHLEANPGNARALVQRHGERDVWLNPPPIPLSTKEMDYVYDLPYARKPHPSYGDAKIPAWEMIRFSVNIMRGCFGGCTFCSITEHEGRIIQSRSEQSILHEIEEIRDKVDGFTGVISDLGGPTANMYRMACKSPDIEKACRKLSCVYPGICENLNTDHSALIQLYRKARNIKGVKKILIGS